MVVTVPMVELFGCKVIALSFDDGLTSAADAEAILGTIILLHPWFGRAATQDTIGPIVQSLRQGYRFGTISELIDG